MKTQHTLIVAILSVAFTFVSCHRNDTPSPEPIPQPVPEPVVVETDSIEEEEVVEPVVAPAPKVQHVAKPRAKSETHYVTSFDSKGPVWGHVTMNGDRGTGVIHDSDENTFSVTCTRHGNELFAVDQNSRQYVFKLND